MTLLKMFCPPFDRDETALFNNRRSHYQNRLFAIRCRLCKINLFGTLFFSVHWRRTRPNARLQASFLFPVLFFKVLTPYQHFAAFVSQSPPWWPCQTFGGSPCGLLPRPKEGNQRFIKGEQINTRTSEKMREDLVDLGQAPHSAIIGCADSRVPLETIFDTMPGDIFVLRNAGNTCTHAEGPFWCFFERFGVTLFFWKDSWSSTSSVLVTLVCRYFLWERRRRRKRTRKRVSKRRRRRRRRMRRRRSESSKGSKRSERCTRSMTSRISQISQRENRGNYGNKGTRKSGETMEEKDMKEREKNDKKGKKRRTRRRWRTVSTINTENKETRNNEEGKEGTYLT